MSGNPFSAELNNPMVSWTELICNNDFTTDKILFYGVELDRANHEKDLGIYLNSSLPFNELCLHTK